MPGKIRRDRNGNPIWDCQNYVLNPSDEMKAKAYHFIHYHPQDPGPRNTMSEAFKKAFSELLEK